MSKKLNFTVQSFDFLEEDAESQFATVEIEAFSSGENLHDLTCPVEVLKSTAPTIYNKPIVFEVNEALQDFGSHVESEDERRIAGFIVPDSAEFFEREDGRTGLLVQGKIWKYYAQWALDVFKSAVDMVKKVSVEMLMAEPDGDVMTDFAYTGVSLLGEFLTEASPGAQARLLSFSTDDYEKAYRAEFAKYADIDFTIPEDVKANCQDGLGIYGEFGIGGTSVSLAMARYIIKNDSINPKRIRKVAKYFGVRGGRIMPEDVESKEFLSWQLYGGESGKKWSEQLVDEMNVSDEELVAYFENLPLGDDADGRKEINNMKDKDKESENFESDAEEEDENVTMEDESPESEEEDSNEKDMAEEEDSNEKDMAEEDGEAEEDDSDEGDMGCGDKDKLELEFALTAQVINEQLNSALSEYKGADGYSMYYVETHDDKYAYVYCYENYKTYRMKCEFSDSGVSIEVSKDEEVVRSYVLVDKAIAKEKEFTELREFKAEIERQQFELKINGILAQVKNVFSEDELEEAKNDAIENFTLETIDGWANSLKAKAFEAAKNLPEVEEGDGVLKLGLPIDEEKKPVNNSIW